MDMRTPHEYQISQHEMRNDAIAERDSALDQQSPYINLSHSSISSDATSPVTSTFSVRAHSRYPSNSSSLASSPPMRESLDGFASKRPLTEVREEPHSERDDERDVFAMSRIARGIHTNGSTVTTLEDSYAADYDWVDSPYIHGEFEFVAAKRQRSDEYSDTSSALGNRLKTLSRKFTIKKEKRMSSLPDSFHESIASRSRASSMRAPSISDLRAETYPLPTPSQSFLIEERDEDPTTPAKPAREDEEAGEEAEHLSRTPLLPPVMTALRRDEEPVQSPLQSPRVVDSPCSPFDSPAIHHGLPSPPLSTRPSISSFHHRNIVPSAEIPSMFLANPSDEWAFKLGHANFTVHPEPYAAQEVTNNALWQLKADWDMAKANFASHLESTHEHYGANSKIYNLTVQKWESIDSTWRRHHDAAAQEVAVRRSQEAQAAIMSVPASPAAEPTSAISPISSTEIVRCDKFPVIRLEDIVGPMEQIKRPEAPRPRRKRTFWRFLQGILPESVAWGRAD